MGTQSTVSQPVERETGKPTEISQVGANLITDIDKDIGGLTVTKKPSRKWRSHQPLASSDNCQPNNYTAVVTSLQIQSIRFQSDTAHLR